MPGLSSSPRGLWSLLRCFEPWRGRPLAQCNSAHPRHASWAIRGSVRRASCGVGGEGRAVMRAGEWFEWCCLMQPVRRHRRRWSKRVSTPSTCNCLGQYAQVDVEQKAGRAVHGLQPRHWAALDHGSSPGVMGHIHAGRLTRRAPTSGNGTPAPAPRARATPCRHTALDVLSSATARHTRSVAWALQSRSSEAQDHFWTHRLSADPAGWLTDLLQQARARQRPEQATQRRGSI